MPRKHKGNVEAPKKRVRSRRSIDRRKRQSISIETPDDASWLTRITTLSSAMKVVNGHKERPYWLSIPHDGGIEPSPGLYPVSIFTEKGRVYYGFLLKEHRDEIFNRWDNARKELTRSIK